MPTLARRKNLLKVSGFTIIRNAVKFGYPVKEAILSVLPLCDEFIVALGNSEDETAELILSINSPKIKIIHTIWDDNLRKGGHVLAVETNKALAAIAPDSDWAFYIQGDEVMHEKYLATVKRAMDVNLNNPKIEGLLFKYRHFYGSYNYIADSRRWYRREVRIIRNTKNIESYKDAQGFRTTDNRKLRVKLLDAFIYHYGWVKPPVEQMRKQNYFGRFWHSDKYMEQHKIQTETFDYNNIDSLATFTDTHPAVMTERIVAANWNFNYDIKVKKLSLKDRMISVLEKPLGLRIGEYRNYFMV